MGQEVRVGEDIPGLRDSRTASRLLTSKPYLAERVSKHSSASSSGFSARSEPPVFKRQEELAGVWPEVRLSLPTSRS